MSRITEECRRRAALTGTKTTRQIMEERAAAVRRFEKSLKPREGLSPGHALNVELTHWWFLQHENDDEIVAKVTGVSVRSVHRWRKKGLPRIVATLVDQLRSGRAANGRINRGIGFIRIEWQDRDNPAPTRETPLADLFPPRRTIEGRSNRW